MPYEIESRTLREQPTVAKRATLPVEEVGPWLQAAYGELFHYLGRVGAEPVGPPYAMYTLHEHTMDIEAGAPVAQPVSGEGDLVSSRLPGGTVARTMHHGPYEALDQAYDATVTWIKEHGGEQSGPHWENYLNSPTEVPNPADWLTEVFVPYREAVPAAAG